MQEGNSSRPCLGLQKTKLIRQFVNLWLTEYKEEYLKMKIQKIPVHASVILYLLRCPDVESGSYTIC